MKLTQDAAGRWHVRCPTCNVRLTRRKTGLLNDDQTTMDEKQARDYLATIWVSECTACRLGIVPEHMK